MAFLGETLDTASLPENERGDFEPIPDGWYSATIKRAELMATKSGTGKYIKVRYDVTGPAFEGRVVFGNFNILNPNPEAVRIGKQQLGDLLRAIGLARITDTDELVGRDCQIKVRTKPASGDYEAQNEVKGWRAIGGGSASPMPAQSGFLPQQSAPAQQSAAAAPAAAATPPWARR